MKDEAGRLNPVIVAEIVRQALQEDVGTGDVTTAATVPIGLNSNARIVALEPGVLAGVPVVEEVFRQVDLAISVESQLKEGDRFECGDVLAVLGGCAGGVLTGERVALNFLQRLCGIATMTAAFVEKVSEVDVR